MALGSMGKVERAQVTNPWMWWASRSETAQLADQPVEVYLWKEMQKGPMS